MDMKVARADASTGTSLRSRRLQRDKGPGGQFHVRIDALVGGVNGFEYPVNASPQQTDELSDASQDATFQDFPRRMESIQRYGAISLHCRRSKGGSAMSGTLPSDAAAANGCSWRRRPIVMHQHGAILYHACFNTGEVRTLNGRRRCGAAISALRETCRGQPTRSSPVG